MFMISVKDEIQEYLRLAHSNFDLSVDVSFQYAYKGLQILIESGDNTLKAEYLNILGRCHHEKGNLGKALNYYKKAFENATAASNSDDSLISQCLNNIGLAYFERVEYNKALDYYSRALKHFAPQINSVTYNSIAEIYRLQSNFDKAMQAAQTSLDLSGKYNVEQLPLTYINIGKIHTAQEQYPKAIKNQMQALQLAQNGKRKRNKHLSLLELGNLYYCMADFEQAEEYYRQALHLATTMLNPKALCESRMALGKLMVEEGDDFKALEYLNLAYEYANRHSIDGYKTDLLRTIIDAYENLGDQQNASVNQKMLTNHLLAIIERESYSKLNLIIEEKEVEIDSLKRQNEQIEEQKLKLEQSSREFQEFTFVFSHDLQEPLRQINSFIGLIERRYLPGFEDNIKDYFSYISEGASRMKTLLTDLMQYASIKEEGAKMEEVDLGMIIEIVKDNLDKEIEESKAEIEIDNMPNITGSNYFLSLLFQNVLHNSIKFKGDKKPKIKITHSEEVSYHLFSISDNGIGIDDDYKQKIFAIFNRLNKEDYDGTGIGLAICRKVVELHGGTIWLESELNKGTTVHFTLKG